MMCADSNRRICFALLSLVLVAGCTGEPESTVPLPPPEETATKTREELNNVDAAADAPAKANVQIDVNARRPERNLSGYNLFRDLKTLVPNTGVIPYQMNAASFHDSAEQQGHLWIPTGKSATFQADGTFDFPIGTIVAQHLFFTGEPDDRKLVETRLLIRYTKGWKGVPYFWNESGTDAERVVIGKRTEMSELLPDGAFHPFNYVTPNMNECKRCHVNEDVMKPIGLTAANLNLSLKSESNHVNQLQHWQDIGFLKELPDDIGSIQRFPDWRDPAAASVATRARTWLQANCAHCHNPKGPAIVSGLDLSFAQQEPVRFGVYKPPVAAGRGSRGFRFGILPGEPDKSFLPLRVGSTELGVMMPPLGRSTIDHAGVALLREWIAGMAKDETLEEVARNPVRAYKTAVSGGNAERGKTLFHKTQKCTGCHRVGDAGGDVGPNLSDVGKRTKADYLLESIVDPNAKIVKGFETAVVVLLSGQTVTGVVKSEDEYELVIADATKSTKIRKDDIDERIPSKLSTMPTVANLLTVSDVSDLIAYLKTLQETPPQ